MVCLESELIVKNKEEAKNVMRRILPELEQAYTSTVIPYVLIMDREKTKGNIIRIKADLLELI